MADLLSLPSDDSKLLWKLHRLSVHVLQGALICKGPIAEAHQILQVQL